ncbi:MAG: DNA polymerase III subunit gamma/tau [Slackia sp.]
MAEALYRKYRPQTFEDVVGQTHIERTLKNAIESDKVSHAYLFCGPRGTGKTTTARLLAKALLCEHGPTPSPDGTCEQCLAIAEGNHPDVNELDAASRTGVENVREEIIGRVQYAPTRGRYKIYIIDEVHMLSTAAFNALLKTLEEPPSHVVFVLCTTDPRRFPKPSIRVASVSTSIVFPTTKSYRVLVRCAWPKGWNSKATRSILPRIAQGGMRDALTTLEQLIAFGGGKVTLEVAQSVLGSIDATDISTVVNGIAKRDAVMCFTWLSEYVETGADLARFARDLAAYMRDLYVLCLTDGALAVDAPQASRASMAAEAQAFGVDRLSYVLRVLGDLNNELRTSTNPRLSFEIALTRMVRPESDLTLEALAARVAVLEQLVASGSLSSSAASGIGDTRSLESAEIPSVRPPAGSVSSMRDSFVRRRVSSVR